MAGIINLVGLISNEVNARIAAAGLPPLVDGGIVLGRGKVAENSAPPRVVFIPTSFRFGAPSPGVNVQAVNPLNANTSGSALRSITMTQYGGAYTPGATTVIIGAPDASGGIQATATATVSSLGGIVRVSLVNAGSGYFKPPVITFTGTGTQATATANLSPSPQALVVATQRALFTEFHTFEVNVWGCASTGSVLTPDPSADYDATMQLYQQVIASTWLLAAGVSTPSQGSWFDAAEDATTVDLLGHKVSFMIELATPLLAEPMAPSTGASTQFAPPGTQVNPNLFINPFSGGSPEQG